MENKGQNLKEKLSSFFCKAASLIVNATKKAESTVKKFISAELFLCFIINFAVIFASTSCFGGAERFSVDSYNVKNMGEEVSTYVSALRPFGALLFAVLNLFNHNPIDNVFPDWLFFVFVATAIITAASFYLYKTLSKEKPSIITFCLIDAAALLAVLNTFFANLLSFPECIFIHSVAWLMTVIASITFCRKNSLVSYIVVSVLIVCATATYQTYLFLFAILAAAMLIATDSLSLKKILHYFAVLIASGILYAALSFLIVNISGLSVNERAGLSILEMFNRIYDVIIRQKSYLSGRGTFKRRTLLYCYAALFILWLIALVFSKQSKKTKITNLLAVIFCYCAVWMPNILSRSNEGRAVFTMFSVPLLIAVSSLVLLNKKYMRYALLFVLSFMLAANVFRLNQIEIDLCKQNALDKAWAKEVLFNIEEYEKASGETVKSIAICNDEEEIFEYAESARYVFWADVSSINEFGNKDYVKVEMPESVYNDYFKGKNWDKFIADEQLVFIGDTLYICNY